MLTKKVLEDLRDQGVCSWAVSESNRYGYAELFGRWRDVVLPTVEVDMYERYNIYGDPMAAKGQSMVEVVNAVNGRVMRFHSTAVDRLDAALINMFEAHFRTLSAHDRLSTIALVDRYRMG